MSLVNCVGRRTSWTTLVYVYVIVTRTWLTLQAYFSASLRQSCSIWSRRCSCPYSSTAGSNADNHKHTHTRVLWQWTRFKGFNACATLHEPSPPIHTERHVPYGIIHPCTSPATRQRWTHPTWTPAKQTSTGCTYPTGIKGWVDLGCWIYRSGLAVRRQSPIQVITKVGVQQLRRSRSTH